MGNDWSRVRDPESDPKRYPEMDYFSNESVSDVVFVINGQRLPAEKRFLSIHNRVFRAMFSDKFRESKDKEVVIEDTTFVAFKTLIQFIYTNELVLKDGHNLRLMDEIYKISVRYQAFRLSDALAEHMKTLRMTKQSIELFSKIAVRSEDYELIHKVVTFIVTKIKFFDLTAMFGANHNMMILLVNYYPEVKEGLKGQNCLKRGLIITAIKSHRLLNPHLNYNY